MWSTYYLPDTLDNALNILSENQGSTRLVAGATDLLLELEREIPNKTHSLIDITHIPDLDYISLDSEGVIHIGPLVTHNDAVSSMILRDHAYPLVAAAWQVGSPQIRNRGTIAGNLITASPANDTIPPLIALGAWLTLASTKGMRKVYLHAFYEGVRKTVIHPNEMVIDIAFPALHQHSLGTFIKFGLRRAQAISLVNTAIILNMKKNIISSAAITLGSVAPTIINVPEAEDYLKGKTLTEQVILHVGQIAAEVSKPIDDLRGSAAYRRAITRVLVMRGLHKLKDGSWKLQVPETPITLSSKCCRKNRDKVSEFPASISTRINGKSYTFTTDFHKPLLRLLRENAGLTGTKEGCSEGECGACTIFLDGKAVMACLVPAPSIDGSDITTIEGLASTTTESIGENRELLHPVQQAFISHGAVQCGYCTPGFIMSASKLLEEQAHPSREEVTHALTGNLCRCTGYYKIIEAVEKAVKPNRQ